MRAIELPEIRRQLVLAAPKTALARSWVEGPVAEGQEGAVQEFFNQTEGARLRQAELLYLSPEMKWLAQGAASAFVDLEIHDSTPLFEVGFLALPAPLITRGLPPIVAMSWSPIKSPSGWRGIFVALYEEVPDLPGGMFAAGWYFALKVGGRIPASDLGKFAPVAHFLVSTWLLAGEPRISDTETLLPPRTAARRSHRDGLNPAVRFVTLRAVPSEGGESGREFMHRWIVRGHWRKPRKDATNQVNPIWIAPYVKGPEGKPFLSGEKVYAWTR